MGYGTAVNSGLRIVIKRLEIPEQDEEMAVKSCKSIFQSVQTLSPKTKKEKKRKKKTNFSKTSNTANCKPIEASEVCNLSNRSTNSSQPILHISTSGSGAIQVLPLLNILKPKAIRLPIKNLSTVLTARTVLSSTLWSSLGKRLDTRFPAIRGDHLLIASPFASNTFKSSPANRALSLCNEVYGVVVEDLAWPAFRTHDVSTGSHKSDVELIIGVRDAFYV